MEEAKHSSHSYKQEKIRIVYNGSLADPAIDFTQAKGAQPGNADDAAVWYLAGTSAALHVSAASKNLSRPAPHNFGHAFAPYLTVVLRVHVFMLLLVVRSRCPCQMVLLLCS